MQKYKVFLNEKSILFTLPGKITFTKPSSPGFDFDSVQQVKQWLDEFETSQENEIIIESEKPEEDFQKFRNDLINLDAAGGVILKENRILFIFRYNKWDLPKGKIDKDETTEEAALREVEEECGIRGHRIVKSLNPTYHIYRSPYKKTKGQWIFKKTHWFEMEYNGTESGTPETDEGITEIRWFKHANLDVVLKNTYENLRSLIEGYRNSGF